MRVFATIVVAAISMTASFVDASVGWDECKDSFAGGHKPTAAPSGSVFVCREKILGIAYDTKMITPAFSAYYLDHTKEEHLLPDHPRPSFYEDPDLQSLGVTQASTDSPAFNNSWNKGHNAPSKALSWTKTSKHATYTMANVAPQAGYFNQYPWEKLEASVTKWILNNKRSLYVITGVGYKDRSRPKRTADNIGLPDYYWKVVCDPQAKKSAGWAGPNIQGHHAVYPPMSVKDLQKQYQNSGKDGSLFDEDACKTSDLDTLYWAGIAGPTAALEEEMVAGHGGALRIRKQH